LSTKFLFMHVAHICYAKFVTIEQYIESFAKGEKSSKNRLTSHFSSAIMPSKSRKEVLHMNQNLTSTLYRHKIELVTVSDIRDFVAIAGKCKGKVMLRCSDDFCINAKSLLGVMLAKKMQWNDLTLLTETDCYSDFKRFIAD